MVQGSGGCSGVIEGSGLRGRPLFCGRGCFGVRSCFVEMICLNPGKFSEAPCMLNWKGSCEDFWCRIMASLMPGTIPRKGKVFGLGITVRLLLIRKRLRWE